MQVHAAPVEDPARLRALQRTRLLGTSAEPVFDRLTALAARVLAAPVALITLVDAREQFLKSSVGLPESWAAPRALPLAHSFCRLVVASAAPYSVRDARRDPRVRALPGIAEAGVVAFLGAPLTTADGLTLGACCAIDQRPRRWSARDLAAIRDIAALVMTEVELREATARVQEAACGRTDALTGLPDRAWIIERLELALRSPGAGEQRAALLQLDVDNIHVLNDSLGHQAGDQLLAGIAERLSLCLRGGRGVAARTGGDEFGILVEGVQDATDATLIAERVMGALWTPFNVAGREASATLSIGIALGAPGVDGSVDVLRGADLALQRAKRDGKARYEVFTPSMRTNAVRRLTLEHDLRQALERDEFVVHYQPKVALEGGRIFSLEALVRWQHPTRGLLAPADFIPLAEETGLIVPMGQRVLAEACRQARAWNARRPDAERLAVSVNLSATQFQHPTLIDDIAEVLRQTQLDPRRLMLEITESVVMEDAATTIATLNDLKALGIALAIDDFGTGYSSLAYLKRFPVDVLKIDYSFIAGLLDNHEDAAIVSATIELAHALNLSAIAEGVETADQLARLQRFGCDGAQGFYFGRPEPAGTVVERPAIGVAELERPATQAS